MLFPCHLYKVPGPHRRPGIPGGFRYIGCENEDQLKELLAQGWHASFEAAAGKEPIDEISAPTRAELEQKASELGVKFDGRTTDKKLAERIEEALG